MTEIRYIDRKTKKEEIEQVYAKKFLDILYGQGLISRLASSFLLPLVAKRSCFSKLVGAFHKSSASRSLIEPFVKEFGIDSSEFLDPPSFFTSFNDFFIRKLKPECRPVSVGHDIAILPADARYLAYQNVQDLKQLWIKGQSFDLETFLQDASLAKQYEEGSLLIARLCPTDYHRFHFPCNCTPQQPRLINGFLHSVNPLALRKNLQILKENKRVVTELQTKNFGKILYVEVGATCVGSIEQTFTPYEPYAKGDEKGYFSFGGSCIVLLFQPGTIQLDQDLLEATARRIEVRGYLGQSLGRALQPY